MTPRTRALTLAVALSLAPAPASATFPPIPNATVPACISLVGSDGNVASPRGAFSVVVRDLANNPMPGVTVRVDLSGATDLRLCAQQLASGLVIDCVGNAASAVTDANGVARFTLLGGSTAGPATTLQNNGRVYADGVHIGSPTVSVYDLDGISGVGANDLSLWLSDFVTGQPHGRSDFDCSGSIGANDLSFWFSEFGSSSSAVSCAASCP